MKMLPPDPSIGSVAIGETPCIRKDADGLFEIPDEHVDHLASAGWSAPVLPFEPDAAPATTLDG